MRTLAIFGFDKAEGGKCSLIAGPDKPAQDVIKEWADAKSIGLPSDFERGELWDSEKGRAATTFKKQAKPIEKPKKMKSILTTLIAFAVLAIGISANAQTYGFNKTYSPETIWSGTLTNNTAYAPTTVIDCRRMGDFMLAVTFGNTEDAACSNRLYLVSSVDGVNYSTALRGIELAAADGTFRIYTTNINTYGAGYMKVLFTTNHSNGACAMTNYSIKYGLKLN